MVARKPSRGSSVVDVGEDHGTPSPGWVEHPVEAHPGGRASGAANSPAGVPRLDPSQTRAVAPGKSGRPARVAGRRPRGPGDGRLDGRARGLGETRPAGRNRDGDRPVGRRWAGSRWDAWGQIARRQDQPARAAGRPSGRAQDGTRRVAHSSEARSRDAQSRAEDDHRRGDQDGRVADAGSCGALDTSPSLPVARILHGNTPGKQFLPKRVRAGPVAGFSSCRACLQE